MLLTPFLALDFASSLFEQSVDPTPLVVRGALGDEVLDPTERNLLRDGAQLLAVETDL